MNFNISVLAVEQTTKQGPKTAYQQLEVSFKNLTAGKVESKKLMSFGNGNAFASLANAKAGDTFTVESQKNDKTGYWDWVSVTQAVPGGAATENAASPPKPGFTSAPKSNYETPEERAKKQVYIVKQSSLSAAIATLSVGAKTLDSEKVIELAQVYTDFVFDTPKAKVESLAEMTDDVPY